MHAPPLRVQGQKLFPIGKAETIAAWKKLMGAGAARSMNITANTIDPLENTPVTHVPPVAPGAPVAMEIDPPAATASKKRGPKSDLPPERLAKRYGTDPLASEIDPTAATASKKRSPEEDLSPERFAKRNGTDPDASPDRPVTPPPPAYPGKPKTPVRKRPKVVKKERRNFHDDTFYPRHDRDDGPSKKRQNNQQSLLGLLPERPKKRANDGPSLKKKKEQRLSTVNAKKQKASD